MTVDDNEFDSIYDNLLNIEDEPDPKKPSLKNYQNTKSESQPKTNEELFHSSREEANNEIEFNLDLLKKGAMNITSVIINLNSLRQRLVEANNGLKSISIKLKSSINTKRGSEYSQLNSDLKYRIKNKDDKYAIVKGKIAELEMQYELLENQIEFNLDTIKGIDSILIGTKNIMDVERNYGAVMYKGRHNK